MAVESFTISISEDESILLMLTGFNTFNSHDLQLHVMTSSCSEEKGNEEKVTNLREAELRNVFEFITNRGDVGRVMPEDARGLELMLRLRTHRLEPEEGLEELRLRHDRDRDRASVVC